MKKIIEFAKKIAAMEPGSAPSAAYTESLIIQARESLREAEQYFTENNSSEPLYLQLMGSATNPGNQYQSAIYDLLYKKRNRIVPDVESYKKDVIKEIVDLHESFPRSGILHPSFFKTSDIDGHPEYSLTMGYGTNFRVNFYLRVILP